MIQPVAFHIDLYDYHILRVFCFECEKFVKSHLSFSKAAGVPAETILASMYSKYFYKDPNDVEFPRKGKSLKLQYHEAKALYDYLNTKGFEVVNILGKIDKALTDWIPSVSTVTFKEWYDKNPFMTDTFGTYDELDDHSMTIAMRYYEKDLVKV